MVVISVDVPKQLAKKFSSDKIVQLKDLSIKNREMQGKINHYEELIPKLYNLR